ncbi:bifunctional nicotinamidase/pyrazinamidase [Phycisphaeraceae bacterium D3-23]
MKALILVDIQNDFVPAAGNRDGRDGALAVPKGHEVIAVANRVMPTYALVVATQDYHPADHLSFASQHPGRSVGDVVDLDGLPQVLWPDHCVQGTAGADLCETLNRSEIDAIVRKGGDRNIDSYSGFFDNAAPDAPLARRRATGLHELLQKRGVTAVDVMGLATDYCVKFTALDAAALGYTTQLLVPGCRGVELKPGDCDRAIDAMRGAGVVIEGNIP